MKHLKALNKYFWKYKWRLSIGIFFILISNYFGVLAPQITGFIIDYVQRVLALPGYQPSKKPPSYDILVQQFIDYINSSTWSVSAVVAISGIDTRKLTRLLRERGSQNGAVMAGEGLDVDTALEAARKFPGLKGMDLAQVVSTGERYAWTEGQFELDSNTFAAAEKKFRVVAYDFGVKANILRMLAERGCEVTVVPARTSAAEVLALKPDGVFLSNGPGDPEPCDYAVDAIREFVAQKLPVFGICLGHQLLALAAGARTMKMPNGHHGANHPVQELDGGRVLITSQNHGFAVDESTLPANVRVTHRSLFDGTNQGIELTDAPAFSFQGHPEASPGPHDVSLLFDRFIVSMAA